MVQIVNSTVRMVPKLMERNRNPSFTHRAQLTKKQTMPARRVGSDSNSKKIPVSLFA